MKPADTELEQRIISEYFLGKSKLDDCVGLRFRCVFTNKDGQLTIYCGMVGFAQLILPEPEDDGLVYPLLSLAPIGAGKIYFTSINPTVLWAMFNYYGIDDEPIEVELTFS